MNLAVSKQVSWAWIVPVLSRDSMALLNESFNVPKSGVEIFIIPAFACFLALQQNGDIL